MRRVLFVLVLCLPALALAWGFDGHRKLASLMHEPLPASACLRQWYAAKQTAALQDKACDPDRWRATDAAEGPRHFLEVDWATPPSSYPRDFAQVQVQMGAYASKNGLLPWRVAEKYGELVTAFRAKDSARILETTYVLSHYVADAFSLLHDTKNADPNGLHTRWESDLLNTATYLNGITAVARASYGTPGRADPVNNIFDVVVVGNGLVNTLVAADVATPGDMPGFYAAVKDLTGRRWGDALTVLASLLWSAWADAGQPELTGFSASCSRAVPTAEIAIVGYPVPGGFTHPVAAVDGGVTPPAPDAGSPEVDGGVDAPVDGGGEVASAVGCGCRQLEAGPWAWAALALVLLRSGRRLTRGG